METEEIAIYIFWAVLVFLFALLINGKSIKREK